MKKYNLIIIGIIISILITGCSSTREKNAPITSKNVYQGTNGVEIEFLKNSPPLSMYEGESFQVVTNLKNKGAYPINYGKVVLTHEPDYVTIATTSFPFTLKGKDIYDYQDKETLKSFFLTSKKLEDKSIEHQSIVLVTACYDYGTKLSTDICIDTDPYNEKVVEKPCKVQELSFSGQGSPVAITRIDQKMLVTEGDKIRPQFQIYVRNMGAGQVISKYNIDNACGSNSIANDALNGVVLKDFKFSQYTLADMDCQPGIVLKLINGEDYFVCTLKAEKAILKSEPTFKSNLYVELEYGYTTTKSATFTIKKINT